MTSPYVLIEIFGSTDVLNAKACIQGRCIGYIDDQEFELLLNKQNLRLSTITKKTVSLKELNEVKSTLVDKRIVILIKRLNDTIIFTQKLLITSKIKNMLCYTNKEDALKEYISLETTTDEWITLTEEENACIA